MSKPKYICTWADDENTYANMTDSLEGIFEEIIEYYDQHAKFITIEQKDSKFTLSYETSADEFDSMWDEDFWQEEYDDTEEFVRVACEFETSAWGATVFLNALARANNRQDQFRVSENN